MLERRRGRRVPLGSGSCSPERVSVTGDEGSLSLSDTPCWESSMAAVRLTVESEILPPPPPLLTPGCCPVEEGAGTPGCCPAEEDAGLLSVRGLRRGWDERFLVERFEGPEDDRARGERGLTMGNGGISAPSRRRCLKGAEFVEFRPEFEESVSGDPPTVGGADPPPVTPGDGSVPPSDTAVPPSAPSPDSYVGPVTGRPR